MVKLNLVPLSEFSQRALQMVQETSGEPAGGAISASSGLERRKDEGSQPGKVAVDYKDVLAGLGLLHLLPGTQGRKPHAGVPESRELSAERSPNA